MLLTSLPSELLLLIGHRVGAEESISALTRTNKQFFNLMIAQLYLHNEKYSASSALIWAVERGNIATFRRAIASGVKIHDEGTSLMPLTALHGRDAILHYLLNADSIDRADMDVNKGGALAIASNSDSLGVAKLLIQYGADIEQRADDRRPLSLAAASGHLEMVRLLLDNKATLNLPFNEPLGFESSPLSSAVWEGHTEVVKLLLERGASPDGHARASTPPILVAASRGFADIVRILADYGANICSPGPNSPSPLVQASDKGRTEVVRILLENGVDPNSTLDGEHAALLKAAQGGHVRIVKLLLANGASHSHRSRAGGWSALEMAAAHGYLEIVQLLLEAGADPNFLSEEGRSPILLAASRGHEEIVRLLINRDPSRSAVDLPYPTNGWTPLNRAALNGHFDIVKMLLNSGWDIQASSSSGWTALHSAAYNGSADVAELLVQNGADMTALTNDGQLPLHTAAQSTSLKAVQITLGNKHDIDCQDHTGRTPLFYAAWTGNSLAVQELLKCGANSALADIYGATPVFAAVRNRHHQTAKLLFAANPGCLEYIDMFGRTIVWWVTHNGDEQLVRDYREHIQITGGILRAEDLAAPVANATDYRTDTACDVCTRGLLQDDDASCCTECGDGARNFPICSECRQFGAFCRDRSHIWIDYDSDE